MIPNYLYIENFSCHEKSIIDFTQFNSALIIGKIENSELYSNGVGKTTIFKAVEYALFNASDVNLEKLIRDDCQSCKVIFDFKVNDQLYRICRTRTKKGTSDLSLFERNAVEGDAELVQHPGSHKDYWKDISGRRAPDTERDLAKLIKINAKSFRSTVHFAQNDFSGITSATPEKRKALLREILSLSIYSKLEKIAKDKSSLLLKQVDKNEALLSTLNGSQEEIEKCNQDVIEKRNLVSSYLNKINEHQENLTALTESVQLKNLLIQEINNENKFLISQKEKSIKEKNQIENSIKDYSIKKNSLLEDAKKLALELKSIKDKKDILDKIDFSKIEILSKKNEEKQLLSKEKQVQLQTYILKMEELKIPLPEGSQCKHCRQSLDTEHLNKCQQEIAEEIISLEFKIRTLKEEINFLNQECKNISQEIKQLNNQSVELNSLNSSFSFKEKEIKDKKEVYSEYNKILDEFNFKLKEKTEELQDLETKINSSSIEKIKEINAEIIELNKKTENHKVEISSYNKQMSFCNNSIAVIEHSIKQIQDNISKKKEIIENNKKIQEEFNSYPTVIEAFSSTGIPNLIIQNLLDELQEESNKLLNNLKPGLQLQFITEKEKKDGSSNDTLDILYFVQGKNREYEQLSGAMKLAVNFSLKLGLSFLLQNMFGTKINLLLLDEIDQSLDKAGVDAFAEIVKFFQKDFTILVITHNDYLKNKFKNGILVEQDRNMVSRAKVVSSW
jgi:DNA repair exonuclease SbcCD ATPase subunit